MEKLIPNIIIGILSIASVSGFIYFLKPFFSKKKVYRDSVGATRLNRDQTGRGHKK